MFLLGVGALCCLTVFFITLFLLFKNNNTTISDNSNISNTSISPTKVSNTSANCLLEKKATSGSGLFNIVVINNTTKYFPGYLNSIINQLKTISPFDKYFEQVSIYKIENTDNTTISCSDYQIGLNGGIECNTTDVSSVIKNNCNFNPDNIIRVVITETERGGSGGENIVIGSNSKKDESTELALSENIFIHELGHNLGLGDLYYGMFYNNGDPSRFMGLPEATIFPNTDKAGCPKWCASYKPVKDYPSECPKIKDEKTCRTYGRESNGGCKTDTTSIGGPLCCVWDSNGIDYFGNCAPSQGTFDIGINCLPQTGCYHGAVYGDDAWRPVLGYTNGFDTSNSSLMYGLNVNYFDTVSKNWLDKAIECCLTDSTNSSCVDVRLKLLEVTKLHPEFKQKIGKCG